MAEYDIYHFAENMKYLRKEAKRFTQSKISQNSQMQQNQLSEFENGKKRPYLDQAIIISEFARESLDDMVYVDMKAQDEAWDGRDFQRRVPLRQKPHYQTIDQELVGRLPLMNESMINRICDRTYYVYYLSGIHEGDLKEGKLELYKKRPKSSLIFGKLETNSQKYSCKLVIEHPRFLYIFGNNTENTERLIIMLNEPRTRKDKEDDRKEYVGGMGLVLFEGSSGFPTVQKMALSLNRLPNTDMLKKKLEMDIKDRYRCDINRSEDEDFYRYIRKYDP